MGDKADEIGGEVGAAVGSVVGRLTSSLGPKTGILTNLTGQGSIAAILVWMVTVYMPNRENREIQERKETLQRLDVIIDKFSKSAEAQRKYDEERYQRLVETLREIKRQTSPPRKEPNGEGGGK